LTSVETENVNLCRPKRSLNGFAELPECFFWDGRFAKPYVDFESALYLHVRVRAGDLNPGGGHFVAILERLPGVELCPVDRTDISAPLPINVQRQFAAFRDGYSAKAGNHEVMLVLVGEGVEGREDVGSLAVFSTVRLKFLDEFSGLWTDALDVPLKVPAASVPRVGRRFGFVDGELSAASGPVAIREDEAPHHVIERGSKVVNHVPNDQAPQRREGAQNLDAEVVAGSLLVYLGGKTMGVGFTTVEPLKLIVQGAQMEYGPIEFGPRGLERSSFGDRPKSHALS